jgi:hypothetical protein
MIDETFFISSILQDFIFVLLCANKQPKKKLVIQRKNYASGVDVNSG